MSDTVLFGISAVFAVVSAGLVVFIIRQLKSQREILAERERQQQILDEKNAERRAYLIESITVIANGMIEDDRLTLSEGVIRLQGLLSELAPEMLQQPDFIAIQSHYDKISHIPYLERWQALDKKEQRKYLREMKKLESESEELLMEAARKLRTNPFAGIH